MATVTKKQLCNMYGFSAQYLRKLMNVEFYEELAAVGYKKTSNILSPKVYRKFTDLYGEPEPTAPGTN
jgi:hypothetical protein